ncbi:MAG TPA: YbdK family carboxylate-amine ligase [Alphaproteobacteria bacterium]|nr:YbdK family carboxylate-amine ligase [Alphaproteobacteria bacterium]
MNTVTKTATLPMKNEKPTRGIPVRWLDWARPLAAFLPFGKQRALAKAADEIRFKPNGFLTLGVEIEINLVDPQTGQLQNRGDEVLTAAAALKKIKPEFCQDTVEINTGICQDVPAAEADLKASFAGLTAITDQLGLNLVTNGLHATADYHDSKLYDAPRYKANLERVRWLLRRTITLGLHVHIGMNNAQECIRYNNFYMHFLPHLLALSASSPFWRGEDTGLFSSRPSAYESIPTAGPPVPVQTWAEFEELYWSLKNCGAIAGLKDLWWDARPSPRYGTLEIRVCDGVATMTETLAIVAFVHLLAHWFADNLSWLDQMARPPSWISRENKWRAMRYGMDAELVVGADGSTRPLREDINDWLRKIEPYTARLGYHGYVQTLRQIMERGNSAMRQRAIYAKTGDLNEVVKFNMREFKNGAPLWDEADQALAAVAEAAKAKSALPQPEKQKAAG